MVDKLYSITPDFLGVNVNLGCNTYSKNKKAFIQYPGSDSVYSQIKQDSYSHYNVHDINIYRMKSATLYDGETKVIDIINIDNNIIIKSYTNNQINFFDDFVAKKILIQSPGSISVNGKIDAEFINIEAESVAILSKVSCMGIFNCRTKNGIGFFCSVSAESIHLNSAYIHIAGDILASVSLDLKAPIIQQNNNSSITSPQLSIIADQTELYGNLKVTNGKCFIASKTLWIGSDAVANTIEIEAEHHIHAGYCKVSGKACVSFINSTDKITDFLIDTVLTIGENSKLCLDNTSLVAGSVSHYGKLTANRCYLSCSDFEQYGDIDLIKSALDINVNFLSGDLAVTKLSECKISCVNFLSNNTVKFINSVVECENVRVESGALDIISCKEFYVANELFINEDASLQSSDSKLSIVNCLSLYGDSDIKSSFLILGYLETASKKIHLSDSSEIFVNNSCSLNGGAVINDAHIDAESLVFKGELNICNLLLSANSLNINSSKATIKELTAKANTLSLQGGLVQNSVEIRDSHFTVYSFKQKGHVKLSISSIYTISGERNSVIDENLDFNNGEIVCCGQIEIPQHTKVSINRDGFVRSARLWSKGELTSSGHSLILGVLLQQDGAKLNILDSKKCIIDSVFSEKSEIAISNSSKLIVEKLYLDSSKLQLKENSSLIVAEQLHTTGDSLTRSENSTLYVKKILSHSPLELVNSLLSAEELLVYRDFTVADNSVVISETIIKLHESANTVLSDSAINSKLIIANGKLTATDSVIHCVEQILLDSTSDTRLVGKSRLVSDDSIFIDGKLETNTIEKNGHHIPSVQAKEAIIVNEKAVITGQDIVLDANKINHFGKIDIAKSLVAKGRWFYNTGSIKASSIYFGIDRAVMNDGGSFYAGNLTCHSSLFNIAGSITATKSLEASGLAWLNFGFCSSNSITNNNLFSLGAGLIVPNISHNIFDVLSVGNLKAYGQVLVSTAFPGFSNSINLVFMAPSLIGTLKQISEYSWDKFSSMKQHEVMPLLCQMKGIFTSTLGTYRTSKATFNDWLSAETVFFPSDFSHMSFLDLSYKTAGVFCGSYTDNSLFHANLGVSFAHHTNKSNLVGLNGGIEHSLFAHSIYSHYFYGNNGFSGGGNANFESKNIYNTGRLDGRNKITVKADNLYKADVGIFTGSAGNLDIKNFSDWTEMVRGVGHYSNYKFSESLAVSSTNGFAINEKIERDCDISVKATKIDFNTEFNERHKLSLTSTVDDIKVTANVTAESFFANSAAKFIMNHKIAGNKSVSIIAKNDFYNLGGILAAKTTSVQAARILNVTGGSLLAQKQPWEVAIGQDGGIFGQDVYLRSTAGNVENHGGTIKATQFAYIKSSKDVLNLSNVYNHQGEYDIVTEYHPGLISGGTGTEHQGLGLCILADGRLVSDASHFISDGSNYFDAKQDIDLQAEYNTYVSRDEDKSTLCGLKHKYNFDTHTNIYGTVVQSNNGRNILVSGKDIKSVATQFISPGGTDAFAQGDVNLYSLKTNDVHKTTKTFGGFTYEKKKSYIESSAPTLFFDNGLTRIHAKTGTVNASGAYFIGAGELEIEANKKIIFDVDILNHSQRSDTTSFNTSCFGYDSYKAYRSGGGAWAAATTSDQTLSKIEDLRNSNNTGEALIHIFNLGVNTLNNTNSLMRGINNNSLLGEMLSRYGLGDDQGLSPTVNFSVTKTKTKDIYQTQAQGGVNRGGNIRIKAGESVELRNGVCVHTDKSMDVDTPVILATGVGLASSHKSQTSSASLGVTLTGGVKDVGSSYSETSAKDVHYVNAQLSAGGHMKLHNGKEAIKHVELTAANINAESLEGDIENLRVENKLDTSSTKTTSVSVSTNGQLSGYNGQGKESKEGITSGIHAKQDLNTDKHQFHVTNATMNCDGIRTDGVNHTKIDHLTKSEGPKETRSYTGIGLSGNIHDLGRIFGEHPTNTTGEQAVATIGATVDIDRSGFSLHATLDVPVTNAEHLQTAIENINQGVLNLAQTVKSYISPVSTEISEQCVDSREPQVNDPGLYEDDIDLDDGLKQAEVDMDIKKSEDLFDFNSKEKLTKDDIESIDKKLEKLSDDDKNKILEKSKQKLIELGKNEDKNPNKILTVFYIISKTAGEEKFDKVIDSLDSNTARKLSSKLVENLDDKSKKKIVKIVTEVKERANLEGKVVLSANKMLLSLVLNTCIEASKHDANYKKSLQDGVKATINDAVLAKSASFVFGKALGGQVGAMLTVAQIIDTFTYDEKKVQINIGKAAKALSETIKSDDTNTSIGGSAIRRTFGFFRSSYYLHEAGRMELLHKISNVTIFNDQDTQRCVSK